MRKANGADVCALRRCPSAMPTLLGVELLLSELELSAPPMKSLGVVGAVQGIGRRGNHRNPMNASVLEHAITGRIRSDG